MPATSFRKSAAQSSNRHSASTNRPSNRRQRPASASKPRRSLPSSHLQIARFPAEIQHESPFRFSQRSHCHGCGTLHLFPPGAEHVCSCGTNNPKAAINITGVRSDLMTIAQAERGHFALEGKYASLDELIFNSVVERCPPASSLQLRGRGQRFKFSGNRDASRRGDLRKPAGAFPRREHGIPRLGMTAV